MTDEKKAALELCKLEYERCAFRYENIYRATWQIFSYLAAISGAIVTFGADRFSPSLLGLLATSPLVFWFFSTFLTMDHYGTQASGRLGEIEKLLNTEFSVQLNHYRAFEQRHKLSLARAARYLRTKYVVWVAFALLSSLFAYFVGLVLYDLCAGRELLLTSVPIPR